MTENYELIVIGAGPGGYEAALEASALGKRVAVVESDLPGGTCVNRGCIPTKALLRASGLYREICENAGRLGIAAESPAYDMAAMHRRASEVCAALREGIALLLKNAKVALITGKAEITAPGEVQVDGTALHGDHILIAAGSVPAVPPIPGIGLPGVVTSDEMLTGSGVDCKRLVIIGGGVAGAEFAQIYRDLGCEVTVIEALPRILPGMDREISQNLAMILKKRGVKVHTGASVIEITGGDGGLQCRYEVKGASMETGTDCILVSTGRRPNTAGLCAGGVDLGLQEGYIPVNERQETRVPGVYAVGDVVLGSAQLASAAMARGRNAVRAMFGNAPVKNAAVIPTCVFTEPEIACAGLTADAAKGMGIPVKVKKTLTSANGKSRLEGAERGFSKLVFNADTKVLLGAQLMCSHASEMIGGLAAAIAAGLTEEQLSLPVYPHPTVSEIICP